ncbi:chemotaxis protein CheZ [Kosakonia radicincitans DSM 16656]|uniref:protein phosphatase CheZ n=1 Tax=Kosakonia TaxID=1330547 RepID=UPI0002730C0D|nr:MULTISPECIES: protein phosphatase CheZ [Kosakonia]APG17389.1 chemotaxis protein CheZ [Kosakonia radicincitans]ARD61719.1 chemotaxis protein CheZ [Kosakonia radicincitans DSM 16656]PTA93285.1 chemotaxis protein CheZ [Kosakonia sp. H7A]
MNVHTVPHTATDIYELIARIGNVTRMLRTSLRELGHDITIAEIAHSIPDARSRLQYVVDLTAQASGKTLNLIEQTQPLQERLSKEASQLLSQWDGIKESDGIDGMMALARATRGWLGAVPLCTDATKNYLRDIMLAQDFPDTTARIIVRMMALLENLEKQFLAVLLDSVPQESRATLTREKEHAAHLPAASTQDDIDELLDSLGL